MYIESDIYIEKESEMDNGNHADGSENGGFYSYRRSSQTTPSRSSSRSPFLDTEMSMKIMRMILPSHAMISDDAKKIVEKCVFEFVHFITCTTSERCLHEQRESITAEDVLWVMSKFGFDDYIEPLTLYLRCYREDGGGEHRSLRGEHLLKHPMVDPASYHLPHNLPLMGNGDMQGDALNGSTSQCADSDVESPEM